ncbi:sodium ion-translocating decarboxylase [Lucifera butyrica]|uniref:Sodium ion-translocating decarboxylase n=1 Tax=Lucifera butyrica TaxID=1351585 RepID=A0A498R8Y4_9FIRM|nr:OadG family protein [Lucifera butyrica]VBB07841.1 sodium ion-translocating decarboxylase [Lucifera butyrica]
MMWLILIIIIVALFMLLRKKPVEEANQAADLSPSTAHMAGTATHVSQADHENDELVAVIMAAIAEFEGTTEFQVLRITHSSPSWTLTSRQELVHGRL